MVGQTFKLSFPSYHDLDPDLAPCGTKEKRNQAWKLQHHLNNVMHSLALRNRADVDIVIVYQVTWFPPPIMFFILSSFCEVERSNQSHNECDDRATFRGKWRNGAWTLLLMCISLGETQLTLDRLSQTLRTHKDFGDAADEGWTAVLHICLCGHIIKYKAQ